MNEAQIEAIARACHEANRAWCEFKVADGWNFGPVKDADAKTHPCLVDYADLPPEQKAKDHIYIGIVRSFAAAFDAE